MTQKVYFCLNPCACGYFGDSIKGCMCSVATVKAYQKKISGLSEDRIDIHVEVPRLPFEKLSRERISEPNAKVRERVDGAAAARFLDYLCELIEDPQLLFITSR